MTLFLEILRTMPKAGESKSIIDNKEIEPAAHVLQETTLGDKNANNRRETEFFVSIRRGSDDIVKTLLSSPVCDLKSPNYNGYKPLDLSLVEVYQNYKKQECWNILEMLLKAGAEPESIDALIYVIRSALASQEDEFILRLISTVNEFSTSAKLHHSLLHDLHFSQSLYSGDSFSNFLESVSIFTIKLIKCHRSKGELRQIYECLQFYKDSYWQSSKRKERLYTTLVVYLTIAGWKWIDHRDLDYMDNINPRLAQWCRSLVCKPLSLLHACRNTVNFSGLVIQPDEIPTDLADHLNYPEINPKFLIAPDFNFDSIRL